MTGNEKFRQIFLGEGQISLTDKLIKNLVKKQGWPKKDLIKFKKMGCMYSRSRNSIIFPPEYSGA